MRSSKYLCNVIDECTRTRLERDAVISAHVPPGNGRCPRRPHMSRIEDRDFFETVLRRLLRRPVEQMKGGGESRHTASHDRHPLRMLFLRRQSIVVARIDSFRRCRDQPPSTFPGRARRRPGWLWCWTKGKIGGQKSPTGFDCQAERRSTVTETMGKP